MSLQAGGSYGSLWSSQTGLQDLEGGMGELEPLGELAEAGFEPQTRARSNTWPLPRPDNYVDPADDAGSKKSSNQNLSGAPPLPTAVGKKNSSRRNAWGNLSYADLITQAITSAGDQRLTLSQIYEWMVQNVPYFKDKGDSNSSAGWKDTSERLFNFVPENRSSPAEPRLGLGRKRNTDTTAYSIIKKPHRHGATKMIKIEIIDGDKIDANDQMCKCNAGLCVQYVVENILLDNVYQSTLNLIDKMEGAIASDTCNGYTIL